jgi:hypothetical protein
MLIQRVVFGSVNQLDGFRTTLLNAWFKNLLLNRKLYVKEFYIKASDVNNNAVENYNMDSWLYEKYEPRFYKTKTVLENSTYR